MTDKQILKRLLELGLEKLIDQNPDFVMEPPTITQPTQPQGKVEAKTDNPDEDAEWNRRFGK